MMLQKKLSTDVAQAEKSVQHHSSSPQQPTKDACMVKQKIAACHFKIRILHILAVWVPDYYL